MRLSPLKLLQGFRRNFIRKFWHRK